MVIAVQVPSSSTTMDGGQSSSALPSHSDNVDEELRRITLALDAVFAPNNNNNMHLKHAGSGESDSGWYQQRQLADAYLTSFQGTTVSWMVCDRILQEEDAPNSHQNPALMQQQTQRRFFAAQTLHTKCRCDVHELPSNALVSLRDSLLEHLRRHSTQSQSGNIALTTRLAMCASALAVQMSWTTMLHDLLEPLLNSKVANLSQEEFVVRTIVAISILRVLPEECASDRLFLYDETVRYQMRDHLVASSSMVFQFLYGSLNMSSTFSNIIAAQQGGNANLSLPSITSTIINPEQIFTALHTWIRYVPVQPQSLVETPLLEVSVNALMSSELVQKYLEVAADVVVEILKMYPSHHESNQMLIAKMMPLLAKLPLDAALASDDDDIRTAYCRVVTEMGESYMTWILSPQHQDSSQIVSWVIKCSAISETEIANITLHFWYRMVMDLEAIEPYDYRQQLIDFYTPFLLQLIDICASSLMKYPNDIQTLPPDSIEDINLDRYYVSETIEDCCRLLGGELVVRRIGNALHKECHKFQQQQSPSQWQDIEACLACVQCMHRFVSSDEHELLPFIFGLIPQLPTNIIHLRITASQIIGKYASWLVRNPNLLQPMMPYLSQGLSIPHCTSAAAVAIRELCECSNQTVQLGEPVLQLYTEITARQQHLSSNTMTPAEQAQQGITLIDELQILEGVCRALSRQICDSQGAAGANRDYGAANQIFSRIVQPIGTRLATIVNDPKTSPKQVIPEVERLTTIVQHLVVPFQRNYNDNQPHQQKHPIVELMSSCWTLLDTATGRFPHDVLLAEKVCRLHKHSLRKCGTGAYMPLLDSLMDLLVRSYERSHQAPFLYAASIVVTEYGRDDALSSKLFIMISAMATTTFTFLHTIEDLIQHPDVVEELFYLMGRMITYCPVPLISHQQLLQSLFQCSVLGMQMAHRDANKGTLNFLTNTISYGLRLRDDNHHKSNISNADASSKDQQRATLEYIIGHEGEKIITNIIRALIGELPNTNQNALSELFWKFNFLCPQLTQEQWLVKIFHTYNQVIPENAKHGLISALRHDASGNDALSRDDFNMAIRGFINVCERERKFQKK